MKRKGYIYILITAFIFSTAEPIFKSVTGIFNPLQFVATRYFIGGLFLLPFSIKYLKKHNVTESGKIDFTKRDLWDALILGLTITLSMTIYQVALALVPASSAAVLLCTNPIFTIFIAYLMLREPINKSKIASIIFSVIGIAIIINPFDSQLSFAGILMMLPVILLLALYNVLGKRFTNKFGGLASNSFGLIAGGFIGFVFILITNIPAVAQFTAAHGMTSFSNINLFGGYSWSVVPIFIWICLFNTGIGYLCYFKGIELTSATEASITYFIKIFLGPIISMIVLKENIGALTVVGFSFVFLGSFAGLLPGLIEIRKARLEAKAQ